MSSTELARREKRAQQGLVQFAEEMQAIRDGRLYPGANGTDGPSDAWNVYCSGRWSLSGSRMNAMIRASPVLQRRSMDSADSTPSVEKARTVATLPIAVQDAILTADPAAVAEDDVKAKAKAARKVLKTAEAEGREAQDDELIAAAADIISMRPKPQQRKQRRSNFRNALEQGYDCLKLAASIAQREELDDTENDNAWKRVELIRYELERLEGKLRRPATSRDLDAEFADLLGSRS